MPRTLRLPLLILLALAAASFAVGSRGATAEALAGSGVSLTTVPVLDTKLTATSGTYEEACSAALRPNVAGVATQVVNAGTGTKAVEAKLAGDEGDWDLAVFDDKGRAIAAGASPDAQEVASGWALEGGELTVQACRRSGDAKSVPALVGVESVDTDADAVAKAKANAPELVDVRTPTREAKDRLTDLGLDMSEHGGEDSLGVILRGAADEATLRKAGFEWDVKVKDLVAQDLGARRREARSAPTTRSAETFKPIGERTTYRTLANYEEDLKALADANPDIVKLIVLPSKTFLGRDVMGVEITTDVKGNNGKPVFFNMGVHHAREWPAGELTMEWALELVRKYRVGDARAKNVVENSRNIVVPIVNPDGFNASRTAGGQPTPNLDDTDGNDGRDEENLDTAYIVAGAANGGEYRRKNCRVVDTDTSNCLTSTGLAENGTDPNRNYGGLWGGPGADTNPATQTYRGPGPFSEPESDNVRKVISANQVMSLITNHTTAALFLRAPGLASLGDPVDELKGYKALGDAVAKETGYFSQKSFELYDTTGTTEDWAYNATGAFGFTNEIYCGDANYATGDCDDPAFHPRFATTVKEWTGESPTADHANDPAGPYDGKGNREGFYIAAESAMDTSRHSVVEGAAPSGARLRLKKTFKTRTSPVIQADGSVGPVQEFDDTLESVYDIGADGRFKWHINPSTRPIVAKEQGDRNGGKPSPAESQSGSINGNGQPGDDAALVPTPAGGAPDSTSYNDHPIVVPPKNADGTGDNRSANVRVSWRTPTTDWDIEIFEDIGTTPGSPGDGKSGTQGDKSVGVSATGATSEEEVGLQNLSPGKTYVLRVTNFTALEPYTVGIRYNGPEPFKAAQVESYTMTCEVGGAVVSTQQVTIERGQAQSNLTPCGAARQGGVTPGGVTPGGTNPGGSGGTPVLCAATSGFVSVGVTRSGKGAKLSFVRRTKNPVMVDVFRQSVGRRVIGERLVARYSNRSSGVSFNGKANRGKRGALGDGYYFVRYRMKTAQGTDTRRVVLQRIKGKFTKRADFFRRGSCDLLPSYKLERPVFGGSGRSAPLRLSYRLARAGKVTVTVSRGSKVVKRYAARSVASSRTIRLRLSGKGLSRGEYRVRLSARDAAGVTVASTLVSRKL